MLKLMLLYELEAKFKNSKSKYEKVYYMAEIRKLKKWLTANTEI